MLYLPLLLFYKGYISEILKWSFKRQDIRGVLVCVCVCVFHTFIRRQKCQKFKAILSYKVSLRPAWTIGNLDKRRGRKAGQWGGGSYCRARQVRVTQVWNPALQNRKQEDSVRGQPGLHKTLSQN